jgi:hypothetical protein
MGDDAMSATTFEGVVENCQVRLPAGVVLPERRTVFVVVPDASPAPAGRLPGVRLADPNDAPKFEMKGVWGDGR